MKAIILLLAILCALYFGEYTVRVQCACEEFLTEDECAVSPDCHWYETTCYNNICMDYFTEDECANVEGCAWNNNDECATFTQCTDYTVTDSESCYYLDSTCSPGSKNENGTYTCTNLTGSVVCKNLSSTPAKCTEFLIQQNDDHCFYDDENECEAYDISACSNFETKTPCVYFGCKWQDESCQDLLCTDIQNQDECTYVELGYSSYNLCTWLSLNQTCADAKNVSDRTKENCFSSTAKTHIWENGTCTKCTGSNMLNGNILSSIAIFFWTF